MVLGVVSVYTLRKKARLSVSGMTSPHSHESFSHFGQLEPEEGFRCFGLIYGYGSRGQRSLALTDAKLRSDQQQRFPIFSSMAEAS